MANLQQLASYPLVLWNDSADAEAMAAAVEMGCRGGTSNPPLILKAATADSHWADRAAELCRHSAPETAARLLANEIRLAAAEKLMPLFESTGGREGRFCVQVDPRNYGDAAAMVDEAMELAALAPNLYVKIPATICGLEAMKKLLNQGIWVTATVSFTVSQVLSVASLYGDFLKKWRREDRPGLAVVLMVGRIDDYLRLLNEERRANVAESVITQAGTAVAKRAYALLRTRRLPGTLLLAAPRGLYHITEFLEMDVAMTAGPAVRKLAYDSPSRLQPGAAPTDEAVITLASTFPEFVHAYEPGGLSLHGFDFYGAAQRTLDEFIAAQNGLEQFVRECAANAPVRGLK